MEENNSNVSLHSLCTFYDHFTLLFRCWKVIVVLAEVCLLFEALCYGETKTSLIFIAFLSVLSSLLSQLGTAAVSC